MPEILVEAPNRQLYKYWLERQTFITKYKYLSGPACLVDPFGENYHGEVIVLNGGSTDPQIRSLVRRLEVARQITVSRREI